MPPVKRIKADIKDPTDSSKPCTQISTPQTRTLKSGGRNTRVTKFHSPVSKTSTTPCSTESEKRLAGSVKEELRRLKLVEYHRKHNDLSELEALTRRWSEAGHKAMHELTQLINQDAKAPSVNEILDALRIPRQHVNCTCDNSD